MKMSAYQTKKREALMEYTIYLYKQGISTRNVGEIIGKSHTWVWSVVKDLSTDVDNIDLT
jgi:transposase-like protein